MLLDLVELFLFSSIVNISIGLLFLVLQRKNSRTNLKFYFHIALMCCLFLIYSESFIRFSGFYSRIPEVLFISSPAYFFLHPILYAIQSVPKLSIKDVAKHFIIPLLFTLLLFRTIMMDGQEKLQMYDTEGITDPIWIVFIYISFAVYYVVKIILSNKESVVQLYNSYSSNEIRFEIISNKVILYTCALTLAIPFAFLVQYFDLETNLSEILTGIFYVTFSFSAHLILWIVLKQSFIAEPIIEDIVDESIEIDQQKEKEIELIKIDLEKHMAEKKPFLNPDLKLTELAMQVNWGRSKLSAAINQGFEKNFYSYVNEFRLNYALELLVNGQHKTHSLDYIASKSGFKNYVAFYRIFKKEMQMSPKEYIENLET